jgi:hypothetical protein
MVSTGGSFKRVIDTLSGKPGKAVQSLYTCTLTRGMNIPFNLLFYLFDIYVSAIVCYSSDIWGFSTADTIERVHRKFINGMLNVKMSKSNLAIYGDTGRTFF